MCTSNNRLDKLFSLFNEINVDNLKKEIKNINVKDLNNDEYYHYYNIRRFLDEYDRASNILSFVSLKEENNGIEKI